MSRVLAKLHHATALLCGLLGCAATAHAQTSADNYPAQTVRFVVPFATGSITDVLARILSDRLSQIWKQTVIVENRPGVAGTASVAKANADGLTLMLTSNGHAIIGRLHTSLGFDPVADFVGVSKVANVPLVLVVAPDSPAKDLAGFIAMVRASPGKLNYASAGAASAGFLGAEILKEAARIDMVHVPYKGTPDALTSVMRGDTAAFMAPTGNSLGLIDGGKVRALAITGNARVERLKAVPTFVEAGLPNYSFDTWFGVFAPSRTPPALLQKISADIRNVLAQPDLRTLMQEQGMVPEASTPDEFTQVLKADSVRLGKLLPDPK